MRLGVTLSHGGEVDTAVAAEAVGIPFVGVAAPLGTEAAVAATVAAETTAIRIVVGLHVGAEHPTTLAEEMAVLDNLSNGRIAVIADLGALPAEDAVEDLTVLLAAWSGRPLAYRGRRWQVPAGLPRHVAPAAVIVTPPPAQLQLPLWVAGGPAAAAEVAAALSLPLVADDPGHVDPSSPVAPGRANLHGDVDADRDVVIAWAAAGATHLLCALDGSAMVDEVARWLQPEVAMVGFPRVVTESPLPAPWPRDRHAPTPCPTGTRTP